MTTAAQAMAAGLRLDRTSWDVGRSHGSLGIAWRCPEGLDVLSYASGYLEGQTWGGYPRGAGACCGGERAQPEAQQ